MTTTAIHRRHPGIRVEAPARMALRAFGCSAFAALVVFHAWLLGTHLLQGKAFEPQTALRWGVAVLVLVGFRALSRHGLSLVSSRHAVVLWLLVVLIHCGAMWQGNTVSVETGIPETFAALAQLSAVVGVLGVAVGIALASASRLREGGHAGLPVPILVAGLPSTGAVLCFSPRPPPRS